MAMLSGLHHVGITVTDLERSERWYHDVLGFTTARTLPDDGRRGAKRILVHPCGVVLGLAAHAGNDGSPFSELHTGLDHIAFAVAAADLPGWEKRLDDLGVAHSGIKHSPTGELIVFRDPDNIQLEVFAPSA